MLLDELARRGVPRPIVQPIIDWVDLQLHSQSVHRRSDGILQAGAGSTTESSEESGTENVSDAEGR